MRYLAVLVALAVVGCGDDEQKEKVEPGSAPVYVEAGDHGPVVEVEPGYGWKVMHCMETDMSGGETGPVLHCGDASHMYQSVDGTLCGPVTYGEWPFNNTEGRVNPVSTPCSLLPTNYPRYIQTL